VLITEAKLVPCQFSRDELFSVVIILDSKNATDLKLKNKLSQNLTAQEVNQSQIAAWYYYSNQNPVL
jgi:hypothetical protein